ncbi:MAG: hypothetical protein IJ512_02100 [Ruminococcus sp.]|nr:hypothetical protein [Ruminococcus sp.]
MRQRARYYLFNQYSHFGRGVFSNITGNDNGLFLTDSAKGTGFYFSDLLDSTERQKIWRRAELTAAWYPNTAVIVTFYAADRLECVCGAHSCTIRDVLFDTELLPEEKEAFFASYPHQSCINRKDIMLMDVKGRYLWYSIRIQGDGMNQPSVSALKIWLDQADWLSFLPEVYRSDRDGADFTMRFLSIFQNLYEQMNEQITLLPKRYDIEKTDRVFLEWISSWMGMDTQDLWDDQQLRQLLHRAVDLYRRTGTAEMIADIVQLYTQVRPMLLENYFASDPRDAVRAWKSGDFERNPFAFTVILPNHAVRSEAQHKALLRILNTSKPAHMRMQLIFIEPEWLEDTQPVMPGGIRLDGRSALTKRRESE